MKKKLLEKQEAQNQALKEGLDRENAKRGSFREDSLNEDLQSNVVEREDEKTKRSEVALKVKRETFRKFQQKTKELSETIVNMRQDVTEKKGLSEDFRVHFYQLEKTSVDLSKLAREIQPVELKCFFETLEKEVKFLIKMTGKEVKIKFIGGDCEVDRDLAETVQLILMNILNFLFENSLESGNTFSIKASRSKKDLNDNGVLLEVWGDGKEFTRKDLLSLVGDKVKRVLDVISIQKRVEAGMYCSLLVKE